MTPDELRALAGKFRKLQAGEAYEAADYLRACADAQPVAWLYRDWANVLKVSQLDPHEDGAFAVFAAPQPQADAQPVPAGWKWVPVEPTQAMNNAGLSAVNQYGKRLVWETYKAMLAAAPAAPQAEPDDELVLGEPDILTPEDVRRAVPQAEPKRDWSTIDAAIREYLDNYELIGEDDSGADACYTPTERELYLIYDAINGLLADDRFMRLVANKCAHGIGGSDE